MFDGFPILARAKYGGDDTDEAVDRRERVKSEEFRQCRVLLLQYVFFYCAPICAVVGPMMILMTMAVEIMNSLLPVVPAVTAVEWCNFCFSPPLLPPNLSYHLLLNYQLPNFSPFWLFSRKSVFLNSSSPSAAGRSEFSCGKRFPGEELGHAYAYGAHPARTDLPHAGPMHIVFS